MSYLPSPTLLLTLGALLAGALFLHRALYPKRKRYNSGLHREVFLAKMRSLKEHVVREANGGTSVRPSEGPGDPNNNMAKYDQGPFCGSERQFRQEIRKSKAGVAGHAPRTVMDLFAKCVKRCGDRLALKACNGKTWTWKQYYADVRTCGRALIHLGFEPHECVNILGFNCREWLVFNCGAIAAGGMAAGVYTTNLTEACEYMAKHSKCRVVAVESVAQLEKYAPVATGLTDLKAFVVWSSENLDAARAKFPQKIYSFEEFMKLGAETKEEDLDKRIANQNAGDTCTLIYTSGTTGNPKAVAVTHDNCSWISCSTWSILAGDDDLSDEPEGVRLVSFLPLSHIAAQLLDIHAALFCSGLMEANCSLYFADPGALRGTLVKTLLEARPTHFFGVPRVWEKIQSAMMEKGKDTKGFKKKVANWAKAKGMEMCAIRQEKDFVKGKKSPFLWFLAKNLVFSKVRHAIGMDRCRVCLTGAAPINKSTLEFFFSLDIPVLELYGMSESTGPTTMSHLLGRGFVLGSCGLPMPGTEIRIEHDSKRDKVGEGEICFRGRHIMSGYMYDPAKTAEAIDKNGWLRSGDVGRVDDQGMLFITGRIKELLIGSGGENVAPVPIEERLKSALPAVSNLVMIGDKRKFFVALVTPKCVPNADGTFSQALDGAAALGIDPAATTAAQASKSLKWKAYVQTAVDDYNKKHAVSSACKIAKFEILPMDFSVPTDEIGPTLKLKRNVVNQKFAELIDRMYPKDE